MTLVLLVDDDPLIGDVVTEVLGRAGYTVGVLTDGRGVLEVVELKRPALVILDCAMPLVPGIEVLRQIRLSSTNSGVPVLMFSARAAQADRDIAMRVGANGYLAKPFRPEQLTSRVDRMIRDSWEGGDAPGAQRRSRAA